MTAKTAGIVTLLVALIGGMGFWQLDPIDLHTSNCSMFKIKGGMSGEQEMIFDVFVDSDICDLMNCSTGVVFDDIQEILIPLNDGNPELLSRINYYVKECKVESGD